MPEKQFLERLIKLVPSPIEAVGIPNLEDWQELERSIGVKLPSDVKELVSLYGCGGFSDFLWLHSPGRTDPDWNLKSVITGHLEAYRVLKKAEGLEYSVFPEPNGLLPWTYTLNGDVVFWLTTGPSSEWPIVVNTSRTNWFEPFNECSTSFIYKCLTHEIRPKAFPENAFDRLTFVPH